MDVLGASVGAACNISWILVPMMDNTGVKHMLKPIVTVDSMGPSKTNRKGRPWWDPPFSQDWEGGSRHPVAVAPARETGDQTCGKTSKVFQVLDDPVQICLVGKR